MSSSSDLDNGVGALLRLLHRTGPATRSQLLDSGEISRRASSAALDVLLGSGLVREVRGVSQTIGRPAAYLQLSPDTACSVGIVVGLSGVRAVITDVYGEVLHQLEQEPVVLTSIEQLPSAILSIYDRLVGAAAVPRRRVVSLGVCIGGFMDDVDGTVSLLGLAHVVDGARYLWPGGTNLSIALGKRLAELSGLTIVVEDRPRAAAFAEKRFGVARECDNFVLLRVGSQDVSAALFLNGRLYRGYRGVCGEVGHLVLRPDGPLCRCGNRGCLEVLSSGRAMLQRVLEGIGGGIQSSLHLAPDLVDSGITPAKVVEAARGGDKLCWQVVYTAAQCLGEAAAALVNLFGPEMVVLGGLAADSSDGLFLNPVRDAVRLRSLEVVARNVRVAESSVGIWGPSRGVAALALEKAFSPEGSLDRILASTRPPGCATA